MSEAQKLIADVDRSHFPKSTESWLDGKTIVTRHKCACGDLYADRSTHLAAEIDAALGGLTRETVWTAVDEAGHRYVTHPNECNPDKREDRWMSGWTEVRP